MSRRIREDHKDFRDVVNGKVDEQIKKFIRTGKLIGWRPKGGKIIINVPEIDLPSFRYGRNKKGWGRGPGKEGDIVGKDPQKGKDKGKPGDTPGDVVPVGVDLEHILDLMQEDLRLPNLQPKDCTDVFQEKIVYTGIRKTGPESLRHNKRTMKNAMLRMIQTGEYNFLDPKIIPIQDDKRFRSWNVRQLPQSNAVIFFARDWSGSMDDKKCDIVINTAWWIDSWIRRFYKRTESVYIGHDTEAEEVDQDKFYKNRYGGGTKCSSAFELIQEKIRYKYPVNQWNIYIFYFSDGENWDDDNKKCVALLEELQKQANLIGIGQILHSSWMDESDSFLSIIKNNLTIDHSRMRLFNFTGQVFAKDGTSGISEEFQMIKEFLGETPIYKEEVPAKEVN